MEIGNLIHHFCPFKKFIFRFSLYNVHFFLTFKIVREAILIEMELSLLKQYRVILHAKLFQFECGNTYSYRYNPNFIFKRAS